MLGMEVGGIWRWSGHVGFLRILPRVRLSAPSLHSLGVAAVLGSDG